MEPHFSPVPPPEVIDIEDDSEDEGNIGTAKKSLPGSSFAPVNDFFESQDSEDEDADEAEQKPLIAPSTNIKGDFEAALQEGFDFDGVFAFSARYPIDTVPNPCLNIDGLGAIGVPLSERDARGIISAGVSACPPSSGIASGAWEIPSEKVHFDNPAWDKWIQTRAGVAASAALNASRSARPTFVLKKLVVHECSSNTTHFKEPIDDDEANTKIGDFIAVLPSLFQGGQLHLRHAGQAKSVNFAHQSGLSTSIVAAYSGVQHALSGVTSGYRLSLVYDIVQPITHAEERPILPEMQGATQKLHNIMLSWKQDASGQAPKFLACLLQHKYTKTANFRAQSLTGADALLVSHLYPLARQLKFRAYLAQVRLTVTVEASAEDYDGGFGCHSRYGWGRSYDYYDEDDEDMDDIDEDDFEDDEESRQENLVLSRVVDLHGMPVTVDLELKADDLLNGTITDENPDSEEFEREDRTLGTRIKVYTRTVLLIWPKDCDIDAGVGVGDIYDYACNTLRASLTVAPTKKEENLIKLLLIHCQTRPQQTKLPHVVQVLRESADRWNNVQILLRTLRACRVDKNTHLLGAEGFVSAYQAFGWAPLKDFLEDAMKNDTSNARRLTLLARLTQMAAEEEDAEVSAWCTAQSESVLRSLNEVDAVQVPWLVDLGLSRGGEFLRDIIFPQLEAQNLGKTFWIPFIQRLQQSMGGTPTASVVAGLVARCVSETARTLCPFPTKMVKTPGYQYHAQQRQERDPEAILEVLRLCVETDNEMLCSGVFAKMRDAARLGDFSSGLAPWQYYADLCPRLIAFISESALVRPAALTATFHPFFVDLIDSMVSAPLTLTSDGKAVTPCPLNEEHMSTLMLAAEHAGGINVLKERLDTDVLKGRESSTLRGLALAMKKMFPKDKLQGVAAIDAYAEVTGLIVRTAIDTLNRAFPTRVVQSQYTSYQTPAREEKNSAAILEAVKLCLDTQNEAFCVGIFAHMRDAAKRGDFLPLFPPWLYYMELVPPLVQHLQSMAATAARDAAFHSFFVDAIDSIISAKRTKPGGQTITPCPLNDQHRVTLMLAARKAGGISILKQRLTAEILKGHDSATLHALTRSVVGEFPRQKLQQDSVALQAYSDVIVTLVRAAIDAFDTATLKTTAPSYSYYGARATNSPSDHMLALVKFCFEFDAQNQCQRLLLRFVPPPAGSNVARHISDVLAPFLPVLKQYLVSKRLDFQTDPYKMFAAAVIRAFAEKVMGQKPHELVPAAQLQAIGCNRCSECVELKAFFCSDKQTMSFARVQGIRTHLERQLAVTRAWGVHWETIRAGSPHTLKITKPASMTALGLWTANSITGKALLLGLGDQATQMRILAADYPLVYVRIHGTSTPLANASQTLNAQKRTTSDPLSSNPVAKKPRIS
ncbi:hypothetical protein B0H15DRAFT_410938 [Mycena belliarum]|uniref:Uncharacterized protein n=1 Tax=Mycena belliarum TaxID=1033014 RepID=A0AAD6XV01_9AGAR|nr:hypothetical protein B0H15DRAFT_410938 [Mycena belliae]